MAYQPGAQVLVGGPGYTPGTLLGVLNLTGAHNYAVAITTLTALDTTNATLSFPVPTNGIVLVTVQCQVQVTITATASSVSLALLNHTGGAQLGNAQNIAQLEVANTKMNANTSPIFRLSGLAAGTVLQVDIAAAVNSAVGTTAAINTGNATSYSLGQFGPMIATAVAGL